MIKQGEVVTKKVNSEPKNAIMNKIRRITNKDKCIDIFHETKIKNKRIYAEKPI